MTRVFHGKRGTDRIAANSLEFVDVAGSRQPVPRVDFNPGPSYADNQRCFGIASSIARSPGGRLWCGFTSGGDGEGHGNYGIVVFSDDDGLSWTPPHIVFDTDGDGPIRTDHVNVWTSPSGVLWILWSQYPEGLGGRHSSLWTITCANPDADDRVWSAPRKLMDEQNLLTPPLCSRTGPGCFRPDAGSTTARISSRPTTCTRRVR
jgi:sialidase-1